MRGVHALLVASLVLLCAIPNAEGAGERVLVMKVDGPITGSTVTYLEEALDAAEKTGATALVLELNTPGGGLEETFQITDMLAASKVPVIGYVHPSQAVAWSAGTVILMGTHVAGMAPFTVIGSSQPVALSGSGFTPINDSKIINALVKKLQELANAHGRNATAAGLFVTENLNLNATEALSAGVVEVNAPDVRSLLVAIHGRNVTTATGNLTLDTSSAEIVEFPPSLRVGLLSFFQDPTIASILLLVGIYAIIFGLQAPGHGVEVLGVIAIILALIGLGFNVNLVGVLIIILGIALIVVELTVPGYAIFGIAGVVLLLVGIAITVPLSPSAPGEGFQFPAEYQRQFLIVIGVPTLLLALVGVYALAKVVEVRKRKPVIGEMVGEAARTVDAIGPEKPGYIDWQGERWMARSDEEIGPDEDVVITGKEGVELRVKRKTL
jgi:membrane-bound serine protease (ClpP class)